AETALDEILRARLLRSTSVPQQFAFAHALVREAVLDECNVLRRARLHRRAADALAELGEERHLEEIAMHLFEAASTADARHAAEMLVRAGRRALERLAYEDAAECFARATQALELADADEESGPVLLARGDALLRRQDRACVRPERAARGTLATRPHRGAPVCRRGDDRHRTRSRRPPRRTASPQLARHGPVRTRPHDCLARGDRTARAAGRGS